jgi:hypothetical protein
MSKEKQLVIWNPKFMVRLKLNMQHMPRSIYDCWLSRVLSVKLGALGDETKLFPFIN